MADKENLLTAILVLQLVLFTSQASITCNQTCPGFGKYPYPFGFSPGCEIRLNCTESAGVLICEFPVQSTDSDSIRIKLVHTRCDRPLQTLLQLYSNNYAPTSRNALLLRNCTDDQRSNSCVIPSIQFEATFQAPSNCYQNSSVNCYAERRKDATYLDYRSMEEKACKYVLSSLFAYFDYRSMESNLSLDIEVVELGWWRLGTCNCDMNATCTTVLSPNGSDGYRCNCRSGFAGDGFQDGLGCHANTARKKIKGIKRLYIGLSILVPITAVFGVLRFLCIQNDERKRKQRLIEDGLRSADASPFEFESIRAATDDFSEENKLGRGGFGAVYKGRLLSGEDVAVKRLSKDSSQGELEFTNEVKFVAGLQHRNLVRLRGFCLEGSERLLVYEFVPNASLDRFIFDPVKRAQLDWDRRYQIIVGIGRELNPKIADFGLAKWVLLDQTKGETEGVAGTRGYMAPEYCHHGQFSVKSDVYSFGVLVLETVSGQKNRSFRHEESADDLLSYAWRRWTEGSAASHLIDQTLTTGSITDIMKCIHIGLLCVQPNIADRPTMASVIIMLTTNSVTLPVPSKPSFLKTGSRIPAIMEPNHSNSVSASVNGLSITELSPR